MTEDNEKQKAKPKPNILKCRDDPRPVFFERKDALTDEFVLTEGITSTWMETDKSFFPQELRPRIEPWLTSLCQSEHLSLLVGSGLTQAVHYLATDQLLPGMKPADFGDFQPEIDAEAKRSAAVTERKDGNIEDQIRAANELLRGLEIAGVKNEKTKKNADTLREKIKSTLKTFSTSILSGERSFISADESRRENAFNYLVSFLMSFASRTGTRDRLNIFTTNYDRFIEAGAEIAGLHLMDRFIGMLAPIFRSSRLDLDIHYNPPGIRGEPRYLEGVARFTKLHGSLDWVDCAGDIRRAAVPFGVTDIEPFLKAPGLTDADAMRIMIYPNAAKDRETAFYPYVELFRDFAAAACRPNHTLIAYGYSFGDEHINRIIKDMLTIPSTHLVVISYDDPLGRILKTYEDLGRPAQVSLLIGDHVGDFRSLVDNYLPKPAIDRTTFRMAELLKARWNTGTSGSRDNKDSVKVEDGGEA